MEFDLIEKEPLEVKTMLDESSSSIMLLDVREKWEFDLCHIPESIHMPIAEVILRISELEKTNPIIIICHNGRRSLHIGLELIEKGFDNVINLKGGVDQWADDIDTSMTKYGMKEILENS
jgi:rhodanese-related sulfurtransferase